MLDDRTLTGFYMGLTLRQREVVQLVSEELSNGEIAEELCVEPCSVAGHLTNIFGEISTLDEFAHRQPKRSTVIRMFAGFFERNPHLRSFKRL